MKGKQIGQLSGRKIATKKSIAAKQIIRQHNRAFGGQLTNEQTRKLAGVSKASFYKYKAELLNGINAPETDREIYFSSAHKK